MTGADPNNGVLVVLLILISLEYSSQHQGLAVRHSNVSFHAISINGRYAIKDLAHRVLLHSQLHDHPVVWRNLGRDF